MLSDLLELATQHAGCYTSFGIQLYLKIPGETGKCIFVGGGGTPHYSK